MGVVAWHPVYQHNFFSHKLRLMTMNLPNRQWSNHQISLKWLQYNIVNILEWPSQSYFNIIKLVISTENVFLRKVALQVCLNYNSNSRDRFQMLVYFSFTFEMVWSNWSHISFGNVIFSVRHFAAKYRKRITKYRKQRFLC